MASVQPGHGKCRLYPALRLLGCAERFPADCVYGRWRSRFYQVCNTHDLPPLLHRLCGCHGAIERGVTHPPINNYPALWMARVFVHLRQCQASKQGGNNQLRSMRPEGWRAAQFAVSAATGSAGMGDGISPLGGGVFRARGGGVTKRGGYRVPFRREPFGKPLR